MHAYVVFFLGGARFPCDLGYKVGLKKTIVRGLPGGEMRMVI